MMKDPYRKPTDGLPSPVHKESYVNRFSFIKNLVITMAIIPVTISFVFIVFNLFNNGNNISNTLIQENKILKKELDSEIQKKNGLKEGLENIKSDNQNLRKKVEYNRIEIKKKDKEIQNLTNKIVEYKYSKSQDLIKKVLVSIRGSGEYLTKKELNTIIGVLKENNDQRKYFTKEEGDYLKQLHDNFNCYDTNKSSDQYPRLSYEEIALDISTIIFKEQKYQCQ